MSAYKKPQDGDENSDIYISGEESDESIQVQGDSNLDRGHWILQVSNEYEDWAKEKLIPSILHAGLHYKMFWSSDKRSIIVQVFATLRRLKKQAASPDSTAKFILDNDTLKDEDIKANEKLQSLGLSFHPEDEQITEPEELAIPDIISKIPGQYVFPPYMYIYGPYIPRKEKFYYQHCHGNFKSPFDNLRTLILLREIMQLPKEKGGAGLNTERLIGQNRLLKVIPGADESRRGYLQEEWIKIWQMPWNVPVDGLQNYYGSRIAMYFAFFRSYTQWLLIPGILGVFFLAFEMRYDGEQTQSELLFFFALVVSIWATMFSEKWKRNESVFAKRWGTNNSREEHDVIRPEYIESKEVSRKRSEITGKPIYWRSPYLARLKLFLSGSVISTVMGILLVLVMLIFWLRIVLRRVEGLSSEWATHISSITNAIQIQVFGFLYHKLAHFLTNWENHPTESEHEGSLALKLSCFQFLNSYFSLFYIAFIKGSTSFFGEGQECLKNTEGNEDCLYELGFQLLIIFLTQIAMTFVNHIILPMLMPHIAPYLEYAKAKVMCKEPPNRDEAVDGSKLTDESEAEKELQKPVYDPFNEYLDAMLQYGFATLFVVAFPLAPLLAAIANMIELKLDSVKVLRLTSRPVPRPVAGIGSWILLLRFLSILSVVTNLSIIAFTVQSDDPWFGVTDTCLRFGVAVVAEHAIFGIKYAIKEAVPDTPYTVDRQIRREKYLINKHLRDIQELDEAVVYKKAECGSYEGRDNGESIENIAREESDAVSSLRMRQQKMEA